MNGKQADRFLRRQFSLVGWILLIYYGLMNLLAMLGISLDAAMQWIRSFTAGGNVDMDAAYANAWGYVVTILVGLALLHAWKGGDYWEKTLLRREKTMTAAVFARVLCLGIGAQMVNSIWVMVLEVVLNAFGRSAMTVLESVSGSSDTFSMFLYASFFAPIGEEILFRGYALRSLRPYGKRFAIWGSAILFGLFHGNLLQTPYAVLMGLILGYLTVEYSLVWAIALHMFNNLVLADLFTRLTAPLSDMAYSAVNLLLFGGFFVVSVVLLVKDQQKIREYRRSEWMDRKVVKCFFLNPGILALTALSLFNMLSMFFL